MLSQGLLIANRYKLIDLLGKGGFSEVWLAEDVLTSIKAAIKIYAPGVGLDDAGISLFTQEFSLVFDMNHTNLLHPTHYDCWQKMPFLILPYCQKGSAFKYVSSDTPIKELEAWKLLHDVAAGLAYLHGKNPPIIHQDIKPDNILISDEGKYMITDFGISARIRSTLNRSQTEMSGGTLAYMGPERFGPTPSPIMASDVWSLGAMMYEVLTGMPPYGNHGGMLQKNGADIPVIGGNYSQALKDLIYSCVSLNPWDRPSAADIENYCSKIIKTDEDDQKIEDKMRVSHMDVMGDSVKQNQSYNNSLRNSGERWQPQNNDSKRKLKKGVIIGGISLALLLILFFLIGGGSGTSSKKSESQIHTINYDSIYREYIAEAQSLIVSADSLMRPTIRIDGVATEDTLIQALSIYRKALDMESLVSKDLTQIANINHDILKVEELLDTLHSFFSEKSRQMKELDMLEEHEGFEKRVLKIENIK